MNDVSELEGFETYYSHWKKVEFMHSKSPDTANVGKTNRILRAYLRGMRILNSSLHIWQFVWK